MLKARQSQTSVTALKFLEGDLVAAGCGMFLKLYNWRTAELMHSRQVFKLNKIHGIEHLNSEQLVLWGGNELSIVSKHNLVTMQLHHSKDRIVHVQHYADQVYILTAHNEVHILGGEAVYLCAERSMLYSGALFISERAKLVAAGTVFSGVVVWDLDTCQITHHFEQHEGSIFDVCWNDDGSCLASCSDDRAIIVTDLQTGHATHGWGHISRIWKLRFMDRNHLVSAAEDCSVRLWELGVESLNCLTILTGHKGKSVWSLDVARNMAVSGGGDGRIMLWDLAMQHKIQKWDAKKLFGTVRSCLVLDSGTAALTTDTGQTHLLRDGLWSCIGPELGPAATVKLCGAGFCTISSRGSGILYSLTAKKLVPFELGYGVLDFFVLSTELLLIVPLPPAKGLILQGIDPATPLKYLEFSGSQPTAALLTRLEKVCVGTRKGELWVFDDAEIVAKPNAVGRDAITSLLEDECGNLLATDRESEVGGFTITLERLFKTRSRKKGSIEGQSSHRQGRIMWGFQNDTFVVWNSTLGFEFLSIKCGGSRRSWDFRVFDDHSVFAYTRGSEICLHAVSCPSREFADPLLQYGTHGREIRGMETCPTNGLLMATASEDTTVALGWIAHDYTVLEPQLTITDGHISGIQCLHWHPDGDRLFTGAGKGELVMWAVQSEGRQIFASEISRMPVRHTEQQELRIMDVAFHGDEYVAVAYSDSSFRIWRVQGLTWTLILESKYRQCCLLNIDLIDVYGSLWLLISSTDGHLVGYEVQENGVFRESVKPAFTYKIHQSSVRCSAIVFENGTLFHYSGGDDNALRGISLDASLSINEEFTVEDVHASAITGIQAKDGHLVTVGSDQKVVIWTRRGEVVSSAYTSVSDTGGLVVQNGHIITCGIGIEFFDYELVKSSPAGVAGRQSVERSGDEDPTRVVASGG